MIRRNIFLVDKTSGTNEFEGIAIVEFEDTGELFVRVKMANNDTIFEGTAHIHDSNSNEDDYHV